MKYKHSTTITTGLISAVLTYGILSSPLPGSIKFSLGVVGGIFLGARANIEVDKKREQQRGMLLVRDAFEETFKEGKSISKSGVMLLIEFEKSKLDMEE